MQNFEASKGLSKMFENKEQDVHKTNLYFQINFA